MPLIFLGKIGDKYDKKIIGNYKKKTKIDHAKTVFKKSLQKKAETTSKFYRNNITDEITSLN